MGGMRSVSFVPSRLPQLRLRASGLALRAHAPKQLVNLGLPQAGVNDFYYWKSAWG